MNNSDERYEQVHAILQHARHLRGPKLDEYLAEACGADDDLRSRVVELLEAGRDEEAVDPFSTQALDGAREGLGQLFDSANTEWLPERIGDYTIMRQIGRGGMGIVYEAQQASPSRRVAIKLLHPHEATRERLRRLEREVALLGRLQHPGIAQIFEAGHYDVGRGSQPFFAMELVDGVDIRTYCDRNSLDSSARLELLATVADAVHYAHGRGIVHRDLKPDNVLVDTRGRPRILDFGIAHGSKRSTDLSSLMTADGQIVGTLAYMAPEQLGDGGGVGAGGGDARGGGGEGEVSPLVDVFALGVLGFELLLGRLPREMADLPLPQAIAHMARNEPLRAGHLDPRLRGDVETILGKALEAEPTRRYESAAALAADIRRHLDNQPIHAHPPSTVYLVRKFARRHRALVAGTLTTLLVAVIGAIVATNFAFQANDRADDLERRTSDMLRLSLAQDHEELIRRVDLLWPPHPEAEADLSQWIADARELVAELPALVAKRDELRALALPRTAAERRAERENHPDYAELQRHTSQLLTTRRALTHRQTGEATPLPEIDWDRQPATAAGLHAVARPLVHPARTTFGQEPLGLALAQRALELTPEGARWDIAMTVALAFFALGRDEEAVETVRVAAAEAPTEAARAGRERAVAALQRAADGARDESGMAHQQARVKELETLVAELEARVNERRRWNAFPADVETESRPRWWLKQLDLLIEELQSLSGPTALLSTDGVSIEHGWSMPRRLAFATSLKQQFAVDGEYARRWATALPDIRAAYPGLELEMQTGLVPIGADAGSGLWEFWHVQSGDEPSRDDDGALVMEDGTGMVLVLLPATTYRMGAQPREGQWNRDEDARPDEEPVHEIQLSPFFISKYEMTQAQWQRSAGANPSRWTASSIGRSWIEGAHPVEQVSWQASHELLRRLGLTLPSEAQWEYACRSGTDTPRPFPLDRVAEHANLADLAYRRQFDEATLNEPWDDGVGAHAPVGYFAANAFGLHDMIGNVAEWCMDGYDARFYDSSPPVDPVAPAAAATPRVFRGGGCMSGATTARSAGRNRSAPSVEEIGVGVRPTRPVTR